MAKFAFLILLLFGMGIFLSFNDRILPQEQGVDEVSEVPRENQAPVEWIHFRDAVADVEFATPPDFKIEKNGEYGSIAKPQGDASAAGATRFFYISTVPSALKNDETAQVYNYSAAFHRKLLAINIGESKNLSDTTRQSAWFLYHRMPDEVFDRHAAKVFVNNNPWEFPAGTSEHRYIFELADKTVIIGAYVSESVNELLNRNLLHEIMHTIKFLK